MPDLGYAFILLTGVLAVYAAAASVVGHHTKNPRLIASAQYSVYAVFGLLTSASLLLIYLFVVGDYSVKYVHRYSDRSMPLFYKVTALWGGQDGSLLFWVWVMSAWSAVAVYQNRGSKNRGIMPYTIVAMMWVTLFFVALLVFVANPFATFLATPPPDGFGLNPLLQNAYMVTHPPSLYLGYIGWTIPFCFAIGALCHGKLDYTWIDSMRRWCLVAWVCLSVGLVLGGLWAYEELGWGGYWAWDPVENAAFIPWLTGTAFIHSVQVQERRGMFKVWNLLLIIITFILTLVGTMMTRSGIVESVHAFAQSDIGSYFLAFLITTLIVSIGLIAWRWQHLQASQSLESIVSREFAFLINNWILLFAAFMVLFATVFPSIYKFVMKAEINVGPAFYDLWMVPVGLTLLLLTGFGPLLSWRKSTGRSLRQQLWFPTLIWILTTLGAIGFAKWAYDDVSLYATVCLGLCGLVTGTIAQEYWRGFKARRKNAKEGAVDAIVTLVARARRRYGGYVVHFGVVLMFVGFSGKAYETESQATLAKGEKAAIGAYDVRLEGVAFEDDGQKNMVTAHVTLLDRFTGAEVTKMAPAKWAYRKPEDQVTTEVDKHLTLAGDVYLVLGAYDADKGTAVLTLRFNPLVNFVWLGTAFLMFGFGISMWPEKKKATERAYGRRPARLVFGAASLCLGVLSVVLAFI